MNVDARREGATSEPAPDDHGNESAPGAAGRRPARAPAGAASRLLDPRSPALTYLGLGLVVAGFGLLAYTWSEVASRVNVAFQLPYVVSSGFSGLGLVLVGLTLVNLAARRREAARQERQLEEISLAVRSLSSPPSGPRDRS